MRALRVLSISLPATFADCIELFMPVKDDPDPKWTYLVGTLYLLRLVYLLADGLPILETVTFTRFDSVAVYLPLPEKESDAIEVAVIRDSGKIETRQVLIRPKKDAHKRDTSSATDDEIVYGESWPLMLKE